MSCLGDILEVLSVCIPYAMVIGTNIYRMGLLLFIDKIKLLL